jgi:hypothetical protein
LKKRLATLFAKLDEAYPDKVISGLNKDHKKWGETVTELYRLLGYANSKNFLMAYGYTVAENKSGRTSNKNDEILAELKRRYPNGSFFTSVAQLKEANSDLAPKIKSLENSAQTILGMSLKKYLIENHILASVKQEHGSGAVPATVDDVKEKDDDNIKDAEIQTEDRKKRSDTGVKQISKVQASVAPPSVSEEDFVISRGVLKQYTGKKRKVIVPETVSKIGERAFKDNQYIKKVILHDGIVRIDRAAFMGCTSLQSIVIPDGIT